MQKAFAWLDEHDVTYHFHDYKKVAPDTVVLKKAFAQYGWEKVINRAGMTWRKLSDDVKTSMNEAKALDLALEKPSVIKRPLITCGDEILLGFSPEAYANFTK